MSHWMNQSVNHEAVCRTVPATPGLSTRKKLLLWERKSLHFGFWLERLWILTWGIILNMLLAGETFNSFQMDGIKVLFLVNIYKLDIFGEYKGKSENNFLVWQQKLWLNLPKINQNVPIPQLGLNSKFNKTLIETIPTIQQN